MSKQIFGWTNAVTPIGSYVGYLMALVNEDGSYRFAIRPHQDTTGNSVEVDVPREDAVSMAHEIIRHDQQQKAIDAMARAAAMRQARKDNADVVLDDCHVCKNYAGDYVSQCPRCGRDMIPVGEPMVTGCTYHVADYELDRRFAPDPPDPPYEPVYSRPECNFNICTVRADCAMNDRCAHPKLIP